MLRNRCITAYARPSGFRPRVRLLAWGLILIALLLTVEAPSASAQDQVEQLYKEAQEARARGDLTQAEQKYQEVIRRAPQLGNAYHNLGIVYFMGRKYGDAVAVLEKAVKINPRLSEAHAVLGLAHYELYEPEKAVAALQSALRLKPGDGNALLYLGKSQLQMREYQAASKTLEKLAETNPSDPDVLYNLTVAYMKLMIQALNRLGEVEPHSYRVWLLLAQDAEARDNDDAAIRNYREALRAKPDAVGTHYALGSVYARTGKYEDAAREFKKELEINANDSLALWKLGELTLRTNPQVAREYLARAVAVSPDLPQAVLAYGRVLAKTGDIEKALEQFHRVVRLAPEEDSVHYHLANAYRHLGRTEEAKVELARFEELAKRKSERTREAARQLIEMSRAAQEAPEEPEPGFSPLRDPTHH